MRDAIAAVPRTQSGRTARPVRARARSRPALTGRADRRCSAPTAPPCRRPRQGEPRCRRARKRATLPAPRAGVWVVVESLAGGPNHAHARRIHENHLAGVAVGCSRLVLETCSMIPMIIWQEEGVPGVIPGLALPSARGMPSLVGCPAYGGFGADRILGRRHHQRNEYASTQCGIGRF